LAEAGLHRYDPATPGSEKPMKEYDHALDALRYLICKLDARKMAQMRKRGRAEEELPDNPSAVVHQPKPRKWLSLRNEELWTILGRQ
jgi:hypothetical protein